MVLSRGGWLEESKDFDGKVTITVRSLPDNWADLDGDISFDKANEKKKIRPVAAVVTGAEAQDDQADAQADAQADDDTEPTVFRASVIADATAFSDLVLNNVRGNQQFVWDALHWLVGEESSAGTVESEEDVKIQHTQEDQVYWFYGTSLGVPLLVLLLGWTRVRSRRNRGDA
jgi:hypothetical protein